MPYPQDDINRIIELIKEIESRKEHPNAAATYKDVPALQEIDRIVNAQLELQPCDRDTLEDSIGAMRYLGTTYEYMWRIAYAIQYYKRLLELQAELFKRFDENDENCSDDYYTALRLMKTAILSEYQSRALMKKEPRFMAVTSRQSMPLLKKIDNE